MCKILVFHILCEKYKCGNLKFCGKIIVINHLKRTLKILNKISLFFVYREVAT